MANLVDIYISGPYIEDVKIGDKIIILNIPPGTNFEEQPLLTNIQYDVVNICDCTYEELKNNCKYDCSTYKRCVYISQETNEWRRYTCNYTLADSTGKRFKTRNKNWTRP